MQPRRQHGCFPVFAVCVIVSGILITGYIYATQWHMLFGWSLFVPAPALPATSQVLAESHPNDAADSVVGGPSLSPDFINVVLAQAHSPATGTGETFYQLSRQYQIDDAVALAFFHHESSYGLSGMARTTQSIGNIRCSVGYACLNGYRLYPSWQAGIADWYRLMASYVQHGLTRLATIIPVYAPASDHNDVPAYIASIRHDRTRWQSGQL